MQQANADLDTIAAALEKQYPDIKHRRRLQMRQLLEASVGEYRHSLDLFLAAVGCVLLIACANVANLQLARAVSGEGTCHARGVRSRTLGARASASHGKHRARFLWCGRGCDPRHLESGCHYGLAPRMFRAFRRHYRRKRILLHRSDRARGRNSVGDLAGWRISRYRIAFCGLHEAGTRGGSGGQHDNVARSALVVIQVALAVVLLAGAGLTLKSFWRAQNAPLNFDPHNILVASIELSKAKSRRSTKKAMCLGRRQDSRVLRSIGRTRAALTRRRSSRHWCEHPLRR